MARITAIHPLTHPDLDGVRIFPLTTVRAGEPQSVLVEVEPDGVIPLHVHEVDARMIVASGEAMVLSANTEMTGVRVKRGDIVFFEKLVPHGFRALSNGFAFISENGGIVDAEPQKWDI